MGSAATQAKSKTRKLTAAARQICQVLICSTSTPDITCATTGIVIPGQTEYDDVIVVNEDAIGTHYAHLGMLYILCYNQEVGDIFIAVHKEKDGAIVGWVYSDNTSEIELYQ